MQLRSVLLWSLLFIRSGLAFAAGETTVASSDSADADWQALMKAVSAHPETDHKVDYAGYLREKEAISARVRLEGLQFWDKYPQDTRRYQWLAIAANRPPPGNSTEAAAPPLDAVAADSWRKRYQGLREDLLSSPLAKPDYRVRFLYEELRQEVLSLTGYSKLGLDLNPDRKRPTPEELLNRLFEFADQYPAPEVATEGRVQAGYYVNSLFDLFLIQEPTLAGMSDARRRAVILARMKDNRLEQVRRLGADLERLWSATTTPVELSGKTLAGAAIDLQAFRGKLVVLDFWATWCAGCIDDMPALGRLYERYRARGLEVISASIDPDTNLHKVKAVLEKQKAFWPQMLLGSNEQLRKYGGRSVPYTLLLDGNGRLVAQDSLTLKKLEQLIERNLPAGGG